MPKYKPPCLKKTTIRHGRIHKSTMQKPRANISQATTSRIPEFEGAIEEALEVEVPPTPHVRQRVCERDAWEKVKKELRLSFYESSCPEGGPCIVCGQEPDFPVTCKECSQTGQLFCRECAIKMHKQHCLLHHIVEWQDGHPVTLSYQCTFTRLNHECCTMYTRSIHVFDERGHLHSVLVRYCGCESPAATLIRYGLWPCSAQMPATAISMKFMDLVYCMMMEGQVSLKAVCNAVRNHSCLVQSEGNLLYRSIVGECMEQFRYFRHSIRNLSDLDKQWSPMECPACPKHGPIFISLDGNFGLVRKRSSGSSHYPPNHSSGLFVDDTEVQTFMQEYDAAGQGRQDAGSVHNCSNFQAGSVIRTKNQTQKLETTGVFGAACRHGVPLVFLNMEHGERLVYPVMTINRILQKIPNGTDIYIMYDIACKLHSHLQKRGQAGEDLLKQIKLVVPVFHAYGHKRSCQIKYGTHWFSGVGLTDGEIMERMWAFLRKFAHITKEMTPSHRVDLLSDALFYFTQKKLDDIDIYLRAKMENAEKTEMEASSKLTSLLHLLEGTTADVKAWRETEQRNVLKTTQTPGLSLTWDEKYVKELMEYDALRNQLHVCSDLQRITVLNSNCERIESSLVKVERDHQIRRWQVDDAEYARAYENMVGKEKEELLTSILKKACEHSFTVTCKRKYSAGQTLATRISRQVRTTADSLKRAVKAYNDRKFTCGVLPNTISYQDAVNPENPIFKDIQGSGLTTEKQNAVELLNKLDRAKEEKKLLANEMRQFLATRKQQHVALTQSLVNLVSSEEDLPLWQKGMQHLISIKLMMIEEQYERAAAAFGKYIDNVPNLIMSYLEYSTNVEFFPSHREEPSMHDAVYDEFHRELQDDENQQEDDEEEDEEEEEEGEEFTDDQPLG